MGSSVINPGIVALTVRFARLAANHRERVNQLERDAVMSLRGEIKRFNDRDDLSTIDRNDISFLYVRVIELANKQESFCEKNGNVYDQPTYSELLAMGPDAPLACILEVFDIEGFSDIARREIPVVCRSIKVKTIGELSNKTRDEIQGPHSINCGNKTLAWIDNVCREIGIEPPRFGHCLGA